MILNKKIIIFFSLLFFLNGCISSPGINTNPKTQKPNKEIIKNKYSINDVEINLIDLNSLSESEIEKFNSDKIVELNYEVNKFLDVYDYRYEYVLGPADSISIDLTDTDDLDNIYLIDEDGMIDLPFIGKIKIADLTLNEAQNILMDIIDNYYKNPVEYCGMILSSTVL